MNTTLNSVRIDDLIRQESDDGALDRRTRITWAARLELRLGLWLLLNSSRRRHAAVTEHTRRVANARALIDREHRALRTHALRGIRT